ncbi:MAG: hypothetical protein ACJ788_17275 [Ktedonobacteraceae bacterium]
MNIPSSLPMAVRKSFGLVEGFAACGGKALNQSRNGKVAAGTTFSLAG